MNKQCIGDIRSGSGGQSLPFSPAVRAGDYVYVSGQTAMNDQGEIISGGIEVQAHKVFEIIKNILEILQASIAFSLRIFLKIRPPVLQFSQNWL